MSAGVARSNRAQISDQIIKLGLIKAAIGNNQRNLSNFAPHYQIASHAYRRACRLTALVGHTKAGSAWLRAGESEAKELFGY